MSLKMLSAFVTAAAFGALVAPPVMAQAHRTIVRVGDAATGISADGSVVAGFSLVGNDIQMFRWTASAGPVLLGVGAAFDISRDGSTVVGSRFNGSVSRAIRWTAGTGIVDLGQLPGVGPAGTLFSEGYDVSADGSVVVGLADASTQAGPPFRGFRWTAASGMVALGDLPGGIVYSQASAISADGQVTVGFSQGAGGDRAVRWIGSNTTPQDLGLPPGRVGFTEAKHVSGDGLTVVGVWGDGASNEAFRWTASGGYEMLGDLPGGPLDSVATATNADGSVIVGTGNPDLKLPDEPFYWTAARGMRSFRDVLTESGIDFSEWQRFTELRDLSDDGTVIAGNGILLDGTAAGFRVVVPSPMSAGMLFAGAIYSGARRRRDR